MAIIGIDLGTTNSLAAHYRADGPVVIPNVYGENLTPSVVSVDENGEVHVGKIARERLITHPLLTASVFKRNMGSRKEYSLGGQVYTPEALSSFVIRKMKEDAELHLGEAVDEAVVSVPAYFNDTQRKATKAAGELAGLKVERIVNEPTAAAVAYGFQDTQDNTRYLVFDLGGGTFDISILEKYKNIMEVHAVAGDNFLGGEDFTDVLLDMFYSRFGLDPQGMSGAAKAMLHRNAEIAKRAFCSARSTIVSCPTDDGRILSMDITLGEYEKKCEALLTRLRNPIRRAFSDASLRLDDIEAILLVGGATKLPIVKNFVVKLFGRFPAANIDPDEVVAMGAAVHSALKSRSAITEIVLTDVCPYTLGTSTSICKPNGLYESGHFCPIIERNAVIPISRTERFYTVHDNQRSISIEILQGESRKSSENILLGEVNIAVPIGRGGQEAVDVRYTYDVNGILEVEVTALSTKEKKVAVIEKNPGVMTAEEIQRKLKELACIKIHPRDKDEYRFLLERGERMYQENTGDVRRFLAQEMQNFENLLDRQDEGQIREYAARLKEALDGIDENSEF